MSRPARAPRPGREVALAALFYLGYTVLATWPQAAHLSDTMADLWDAKLSSWILHWDYVQTLRDPLNLFQAPILHPAKYVLAFSENMYGAAVFGFPLLAAGASLVVNYNVLLLLGMFLSGLAAWAMARYVTGDAAAALVGGLVYAFLPYKLAQLAHFHMEWGPFLPLVFLFLLRYLDGGRRRDAVLLGVCFAWNAITCIQYAFFTGFLVAIVLAFEGAVGSPDRGRRLRGACLAIFLGFIAFLPFAVPYKKATDLYGMRRTVGEMTFYSAQPWYFLSAGERNKFWGPVTTRWRGPEGDFFPGLVPLALAGIAIVRLRRRAASAPDPEADVAPARRRLARLLDAVSLVLLAAWLAARATPNLRVGPLSLGDAGRVQVFLTMAILARLAVAFPKRSRYRSLSDFLRRAPLDRRAMLLLLIGFAGILISLGGHTPYYRFLFQSFGSVFRGIRAVARGVVLFQAAIAVLAAWGLSLLTRNHSRAVRGSWIAGTIALITLEYRAFPLRTLMYEYNFRPVPVYEWLRAASVPEGVIEWPLGFPYDCEYTLRQSEHGKPLVNGHSSFAPKPYERLQALLRLRPIPDSVWTAMASLDGGLLIYHAHETQGLGLAAYAQALDRALSTGGLELVRSFPHDDGEDFVFAPAGAAWAQRARQGEAQRELRTTYDSAARAVRVETSRFAPPFAGITFPEPVTPGQWHGGWALDDSGIAEIQIASELGPVGGALLHMRHPGLSDLFPDYSEAKDNLGGFGFAIPSLPPGPHTLTFTLIANDGGVTVLTRPIMVAAPPAQPRSR